MAKLPTFKLVLTDELRASLEALAEQEGLSLAELMRRRLQETMDADDPLTQQLQTRIRMLVALVGASTGWHFARHPAAAETLRRAISILLERYGARPDAKFTEDDIRLGARLVPGTDPATIAAGIETIASTNLAADVARAAAATLREGESDLGLKDGTISSLGRVERLMAEMRQKERIVEEGGKDEAAEKPKRRRMRKSERE